MPLARLVVEIDLLLGDGALLGEGEDETDPSEDFFVEDFFAPPAPLPVLRGPTTPG